MAVENLFRAFYEPSSRPNALAIMARAFDGKAASLAPLLNNPAGPMNLRLAALLVYVSVAEASAMDPIFPMLLASVLDPAINEELLMQVFVALACRCPAEVVVFAVERMHPLLEGAPEPVRTRCLEVYERLFGGEAAPELASLASLFLIPVLRCIADAEAKIRAIAAPLFALLMRLLPLKTAITTPALQSLSSQQQRADEFLAHFVGDSMEDLRHGGGRRAMTIPDYKIPVEIKADLRPYQRAGINWILYLAQYGLHGALCDDMGLGKTLQTITVLACQHHQRLALYGDDRAVSLVVCPASLVGHWQHEIQQYAPSLGPCLVYAGSAAERRKAWSSVGGTAGRAPRVVIASYETVRSDVAVLDERRWHYLVLDEGHMIKNPKTKLTLAIKTLRADHRLILSGTPIQNSVVELWSLFDFLMPGMLGTEAQFMERYGRPIMAVQPAVTGGTAPPGKAGMKEFEEAERKTAALHKQVLPFLLRRMKEDVLKELPPKIIQDYECEPSPVQRLLYEDLFNDAALRRDIAESLGEGRRQDKMHVFQTLQYLRKLLVHPALVLTDDHPLLPAVQEEMARMGLGRPGDEDDASSEGAHPPPTKETSPLGLLNELSVAPKFQLLRELLEECGLGDPEEKEALLASGGAPHRVLIFAQQKSTLDLIESLVFGKHLAHLTYLRLDGSVEHRERFRIAQRFNADPAVDVLLLTTSVGGLGLNLTGADTVIFVEHDWNPMKDLQAMDRAHRLGQRRVVNVYRLIMRGTLEEQILGLQRWKSRVASTIVQQQGALQGDAKMQSSDLLDLLVGDDEEGEGDHPPGNKRKRTQSRAGAGPQAMDKWLARHGATLLDTDAETTADQQQQLDKVGQEYATALDADAFARSIMNPKGEGLPSGQPDS